MLDPVRGYLRRKPCTVETADVVHIVESILDADQSDDWKAVSLESLGAEFVALAVVHQESGLDTRLYDLFCHRRSTFLADLRQELSHEEGLADAVSAIHFDHTWAAQGEAAILAAEAELTADDMAAVDLDTLFKLNPDALGK